MLKLTLKGINKCGDSSQCSAKPIFKPINEVFIIAIYIYHVATQLVPLRVLNDRAS